MFSLVIRVLGIILRKLAPSLQVPFTIFLFTFEFPENLRSLTILLYLTSRPNVCITNHYLKFVWNKILRSEFKLRWKFSSWIAIRDVSICHASHNSPEQLGYNRVIKSENLVWHKFQVSTINTSLNVYEQLQTFSRSRDSLAAFV